MQGKADETRRPTRRTRKPGGRTKKQSEGGNRQGVVRPPEHLVTVETAVEGADYWASEEAAADRVTLRKARAAEQRADGIQRGLGRAAALEGRGRRAFAAALASAYAMVLTLIANPGLLVALCALRRIKLTQATRKSPCLVFVKALLPDTDAKVQSQYARVMVYGLACGLGREEFQAAIEKFGTVQIAAWEAKRRALREGRPAKQDASRTLIKEFVERQAPLPIGKMVPPADGQPFLAVCGTTRGKVVVYRTVEDRRLLQSVVRQINRDSKLAREHSSGNSERQENRKADGGKSGADAGRKAA